MNPRAHGIGLDEMAQATVCLVLDATCTRCGEMMGSHVVSGGYACCADGKRAKSSASWADVVNCEKKARAKRY